MLCHAQTRSISPSRLPHHIIQRGHNRQVVFASEPEWKLIRDAVQRGQLTVNRKFER